MSLLTKFKLPDVGEGLTEAEVVAWHVKAGDRVEVNDTLLEIETAKSVVELPSPIAGVIETLHIDVGVTVPVGTALVSIRDSAAARQEAVALAKPPADVEPSPAEDKPLVLVGTGPTAAVARRRKLQARPDGVVPRTEVEPAAAALRTTSVDASQRETRTPIKGVRKATAAAMTSSAFTAPHVTEWLTLDVTATMALVGRLKTDRRWEGVRVTPLLLVAKAFLLSIREQPEINARWDEAAQEIVVHHDVNLGIAAATPRGLMVPNIKNAQALDLRGLAEALDGLVQTARSGKTTLEDMSRGTITITNIGALGVDAGTPILNPGEAAILAFGAVRDMPWVVEGQVVVRKVTQLAMSFDHRLVDGELGSNVLASVGRLLEDPAQAMLF